MSLERLHSFEFVERWNNAMAEIFAWQKKDHFCLVPSLNPFKKKTHSNAPFLSYGSLSLAASQQLADKFSAQKKSYLLRGIEGVKKDIFEGNPVVMRLLIKGLNEDRLMQTSLDGYCRNRLRKAQAQDYRLEMGDDEKLIHDAHAVYQRIMKRLGTPAWPRKMLEILLRENLVDLFVLYRENKAVALLVLIKDEPAKLVCVAWCGAIDEEMPLCANYLTHWHALLHAMDKGYECFDFGRSPFAGGTYQFKKKWGAQAVSLHYFDSKPPKNLYKKYAMASKLWKIIPNFITNFLGPRLVRYLPDM